SLNRQDVCMLRKLWPRTLIVKGVLHPQDAILAADCGADGVVVSNHGGRNLGRQPAPLRLLAEIIGGVGHRMKVVVDSGCRRGGDVVKALALGAQAVLIGRATLYGAAIEGGPGAARAIGFLHEEIDRVMALLGCASINDVTREHLVLPKRLATLTHA